jgi:hypothetical protein
MRFLRRIWKPCRRTRKESKKGRALSARLVLLVGDVLEPLDGFAVERFLDGDVGQGGGWGGAVPVFFAWGEPDDVAGMNLLDGSAPALSQA